jgi:aconitate hydratase 2/2-methylisocitrate dehydratase
VGVFSIFPLPTPAEYLAVYKEKVAPKAEQIYKYLQFDEMSEYK